MIIKASFLKLLSIIFSSELACHVRTIPELTCHVRTIPELACHVRTIPELTCHVRTCMIYTILSSIGH